MGIIRDRLGRFARKRLGVPAHSELLDLHETEDAELNVEERRSFMAVGKRIVPKTANLTEKAVLRSLAPDMRPDHEQMLLSSPRLPVVAAAASHPSISLDGWAQCAEHENAGVRRAALTNGRWGNPQSGLDWGSVNGQYTPRDARWRDIRLKLVEEFGEDVPLVTSTR